MEKERELIVYFWNLSEFEDLRCGRRIRLYLFIYIYIIYLLNINYIYIYIFDLDGSRLEPERVVYLFTNVLVVVGLHLVLL